ncbi:MAG TPA: YkgJ family cysteine cluster protein [bacterium]|nr:YkgJ family cysteine cluster protein [bacterium]
MNADQLKERKEAGERILAEAPRLGGGDKFVFSCHPGISCFNQCCRNVNIVLTPLDILRMSRRLKMTTTDFLTRHTFVPFSEDQKLPFVFLRMNDDEERTCPFVGEKGCGIYEDRPWPCRMYPVGEASPEDPATQGGAFYFLIQEDHCRGHEEKNSWTIADWTRDQGVPAYREMGELFKRILLHPYLSSKPLDPARIEMFYMACYDLDKFREFVFQSQFLTRFVVEPETLESMRSDDLELMKFAFRWLGFALFGELTIKLNEALLSEREREMLKRKKY